MWKMSKRLAACVFAAAWWSIFYPELCFSEETCAVVRTENVQDESGAAQVQTEHAQEGSEGTQAQTERAQDRGKERQSASEEIDAAALWQAAGDEIVIRSRLWEWCEENLFDAPEACAKNPSKVSAKNASAGR